MPTRNISLTPEHDAFIEKTVKAHKPDFKAYLLGGPKVHDFPIRRNRDTGRAVEF